MGSFNTTCALTGKVISQNTETIMILLTKKGIDNALAIHTWDDYSPIPIIFEGKYDSYGRLENAKIFQSKEVLSASQLKIANDYVFKQLKNKTNGDYEAFDISNPKNLSELMTMDDWGFSKTDPTSEILKALLKLANEGKPEEALEVINVYEEMFGKFRSIDEVEAKIEKLEEEQIISLNPIHLVYFEKQSYLKLVNEYGYSEDKPDEDIYSQKVQHERRQGLPPERGTSCVMLGLENFAGSNYPAYTLSRNLKEEVKKVLDREVIRNLENLYVQDLTLVNDYFSMLGRSWMPSMAVSEDIKHYGHDKALAFQRDLLVDKPAKKNKPLS